MTIPILDRLAARPLSNKDMASLLYLFALMSESNPSIPKSVVFCDSLVEMALALNAPNTGAVTMREVAYSGFLAGMIHERERAQGSVSDQSADAATKVGQRKHRHRRPPPLLAEIPPSAQEPFSGNE